MKIIVRVVLKREKEKIKKKEEGVYEVFITSPPKNNKANREVESILANFFNKSLKDIKIVSGKTRKEKIVIIKEE